MRVCLLTFVLCWLAALGGCATPAVHPGLQLAEALPDLIPVRDFVASRAANFSYRLSPDGKQLAWIGVEGVSLHFFIKDLVSQRIRTFLAGRFYGSFEWAQDSRRLLFAVQNGDENVAYLALDTQAADAPQRLLSPWGAVKAVLVSQLSEAPGQVLIAHNQRDAKFFDLYQVDIETAEQKLVASNPGHVVHWLTTPRGRLAGRILKQEGAYSLEILRPDQTYQVVYGWSEDDEVRFVSLVEGGARLYLLSNKGRDRLALVEVHTISGEQRVVHAEAEVDVEGFYTHPRSGLPLFAFAWPDYPKATPLEPSLDKLAAFLRNKAPAGVSLESSDRDFRQLILVLYTDKGSETYRYDTERNQAERLGGSPSLAFRDQLADSRPITLSSRDGLMLHGYLSLPKGVEPRRLPTVLWVHGGPWQRDVWRYDPDVQFLANRGYAVLQVNYRGSSGYGRRFQQRAIGEFGGRMQDDLLDAVAWAVAQGFADPARIAIAGGSYGGYATLMGLAGSPQTFACGIDLFGPTDLIRLIEDFPPYWKPEMQRWHRYVGDPAQEGQRPILRARSPLFMTERIVKPLLVMQGGRDVRVRPGQSIELVERLRAQLKPVDFWLIPEAGHGLIHWPQRLSQFRRTEDFLAACLGGRSGGLDFYQLGSWLF